MKNNLQQLRDRLRLSQKEIGELINRSHNAVCGYENGRTTVPVKLRDAYAKALNISWEEYREWPDNSVTDSEVASSASSDFALLTMDELVTGICSRAEKLKVCDGNERIELVKVLRKMAVELERMLVEKVETRELIK